ncbi:hypothetical protein G3O08_19035 [Cryomorpha ignava]|uniref:Uncharacterized protein n=1 Tax=Cryomorpha ignava TaxID=101383 RepID=A0A7K3WWZ9_9FLAO|nr:hypothetical protein [Cryomorpha ignava]NEN25591.1 hypothetical protein [Cryomorpha ignava]
MKVKLLVLGLMLLCLNSYAQENSENICGSYKDGLGDMVITKLILKEDSTFELTTPDPIFAHTHENYTNMGRWTYSSQSVILNQSLKPRQINVEIKERHLDSSDSITVKINYILDVYENEKLISSEPFEFEMLTLTLNGKKKGYNFRSWESHRTCLFAPKVKNQVLLDSLGTAQIPRKDLKSISVYGYGFDQPLILSIENRETNYLEIKIIHPVDRERMPRNKQVIVKGDRAFYYELNGKVLTTGMLSPLVKQK